MAEQTSSSGSAPAALPDEPSLEWLRKQAKRRLEELRLADPAALLADAQFALARQYGFSSWRALKAHVDSLTTDGRLIEAARSGDVSALEALLRESPDGLQVRTRPHEWTLLHVAADGGHLAAVDLLLQRGLDVNAREKGDNTYAMHWAAAGGHLDVVRRLAEAGGDVVGSGDDHELEVIGWATCWEGTGDDRHRSVADYLAGRGARHHIFSAIAMNLADEVRRLVAADPAVLASQMSRHENQQLPLHFAVRMNRPEMVELLLDLGADPAATDGYGLTAAVYAAAPEVDEAVIATLTRRGALGLFGALALGDKRSAGRLLEEEPELVRAEAGLLHLVAKRGDVNGAQWLLDRGADPNARWNHWDAVVTPLHLAAAQGHAEVVRLLLKAGADPEIRDTKHGGDAKGWAAHGRQPPSPSASQVIEIIEAHQSSAIRTASPRERDRPGP
jgi:ankyrin repeat protein